MARAGLDVEPPLTFNATDYLLMPALESGRLEMVSGAVVTRVLTDESGPATAVQYFDRESGVEREVPARTVVVATSTMDSMRILLNSTSPRYPRVSGTRVTN